MSETDLAEGERKPFAAFLQEQRNGSLHGYRLERPDTIRRDALKAIADRLAETFPLTYVGSPA